MKNKILKTVIVLILINMLTLTNFISVGIGLISYANDNVETNHKNIEFSTETKDSNKLIFKINVKKEGYFNGKITLENSNFELKKSESTYVNKIENNTITLNQLNASTTAQIEVEIEPVKKEIYDAGLLNDVTNIKLSGIYRDSTEKDIEIKAERELKIEIQEQNTLENIENTAEIITNKIVKIGEDEKRVLQLSIDMGLKDDNYPIKEITSKITVPKINKEKPEIIKNVKFNNMTYYDYKYEGTTVEFKFNNNPNEQNKILWRQQGNEKIVLTLIYNKDAEIKELPIKTEQKVTLYNNKVFTTTPEIILNEEEKDSIIQINNTVVEEKIYKGKLYAGIDRQYETKTELAINLSKVNKPITIQDESAKFTTENSVVNANVVYNRTIISKEKFDKMLGENGIIKIYNEKGEEIATVDSSTVVDSNKNIVIDYSGKEPQSLKMELTAPISEGYLEFNHINTIKKQEKRNIELAKELSRKTTCEYGTNNTNSTESKISLEESNTVIELQTNKNSLSTVVQNNIEIRAILNTNNEQYKLYKNPTLNIELPEGIESIELNSVELVYENELKIAKYNANGRNITIELKGEQTQYKDIGIQGATIIVNANVNVNKKSATRDAQIIMTCNNNGDIQTSANDIRIVAPKDITAINSIKELSIETIGQEETKQVSIERGANAKQLETEIEVINNNENTVSNVVILGKFPTRNSENNIDIKVLEGINLQGIEGVQIYYTENEKATSDVQNAENNWQTQINDGSKVSKYLIIVPELQSQSSVKATYKIEIPELLEYNQIAKQSYEVTYTDGLSRATRQAKSTVIEMETGVGPRLEATLKAFVGKSEIASNTSVKNGEVIKYNIQVANTGSEEINNLKVVGNVPEGTKLVVPQENYEYTGTSYYKELEDEVYETTVEKVKVGETVNVEYEVRVNKDLKAGTVLNANSKVKYGDVIKSSNEIKLVSESGNIRVTVKRITDTKTALYELAPVQYYAIIENISNERQENVKVKTIISDAVTVSELSLIKGMKAEDVSDRDLFDQSSQINEERILQTPENNTEKTPNTSEGALENNIEEKALEYKEELEIGNLEAGEIIVLNYDMLINKVNDKINQIDFAVTVNSNKKQYNSNIVTDKINNIDVSISMTSNTKSTYVKAGDVIEYTIKIKNETDNKINNVYMKTNIPNQLTVNKVTLNGKELSEINTNTTDISCDLSPNSESIIKIEAVVDASDIRAEADPITNIAYVSKWGEILDQSEEVTHIIEANPVEPGEDDPGTDEPLPNDPGADDPGTDDPGTDAPGTDTPNSDIADRNKTITGMAWFDENANGQKDKEEKHMSKVKVKLINTKTNKLVKDKEGKILEATTNENGVYVLNNIEKGSYIVVFEYDNTQYTLTKYKATNVAETMNSNAMLNKINVDGEVKESASTDIIQINDENIADINIGLIKLQNFDLKLDKFVNKIIVQNSAGTTVREFNDETLAKVELDSKKIAGTTVIIEYTIRVTNIGEIDGYVRKIADYIPNDLSFNSELNKEWYQTGGILYNASIANDKIAPGEAKEVTLILTKTMTENNVGRTNNTAEIAESYNQLGFADSNSTAGNRQQGENDMGAADVILGIKTGSAVWITTSVVIIALAIVASAIMIIIKKKDIKR